MSMSEGGNFLIGKARRAGFLARPYLELGVPAFAAHVMNVVALGLRKMDCRTYEGCAFLLELDR